MTFDWFSLNPYSTGNEVVGGKIFVQKFASSDVLILILLEMRLLASREAAKAKAEAVS